MYLYFYDKSTQEPRHTKQLAAIETRLIELGIHGRVEKLSIFKNADELIHEAVGRGVRTVVVVGCDETFFSVLNILAPLDATIGYIPLTESRLSRLFGLPIGEESAAVLSQRIKIKAPLGAVNNQFFLQQVEFSQPSSVTIHCNDSYQFHCVANVPRCGIENTSFFSALAQPNRLTTAQLLLYSTRATEPRRRLRKPLRSSIDTRIPIATANCTSSQKTDCLLDGLTRVALPCAIRPAEYIQEIIVGRDRQQQ